MKKFALVSMMVAGLIVCQLQPVNAQQKKKPAAAPKAAPAKAGKLEAGFSRVSAVEYKIVKDVPGKTAQVGDVVEFHILVKCDTLVLGDSRAQQAGKPAAMPVGAPQNATDWQAVLPKLSAGDSAYCRVWCDSILATVPPGNTQPLPPWLVKGNKVEIFLSVVSVKPKAQYDEEQKMAAALALKDEDKNMQEFFTKNNLKPIKTASGLYYTITKEGAGDAIKSGQNVSMHYVGKLMNGSTFDSNQEPAKPFEFPVGQGRVIKGWDEGVQLLKKGTKASFYIPSQMAYGAQSPTPAIPPNSPLVFDVEVVDVK